MNLTVQLQQYFGYPKFRTGQQETIEYILAGHSALAIFPTGSGKSLCYQLSALNLPHLTLVVSPLLSLMHDQLSFLHEKGIPAASLDSSLSREAYAQVMEDVRSGRLKILMISVERFKNERFRQFIEHVAISLLVVDEAHCISEWGHNFRPDYLKLPHYMKALNIPQALLLTATAPVKVKKDVQEKFNIQDKHVVQTGFYRSNLDIAVEAVESESKQQRLIEIVHSNACPTIVYVTLQQSAEHVAQALINAGVKAAAYHAGLASDYRQLVQSRFMNDELSVVVATIAFGMGIDKSNISQVIHYDLPKSIENYSQEIGRAGRNGGASRCVVLGDLSGVSTLENFIYGDTPEPQSIKLALEHIVANTCNGQWEYQGMALSTLSNIRQLPLKTLLVALELHGVVEPMYSYFAEYRYKFLEDKSEILQRFNQERQHFLTMLFEQSVCKKVWCEPPLGANTQVQFSERERAIAALEYLDNQGLIELSAKGSTEVYRVNTDLLSQHGLVTELADYFAHKEQAEINRINEMISFLGNDSCLTAALCGYFDDDNAPAHCGHCSACRNGRVLLTQTNMNVDIADLELAEIYQEFKQAVEQASELNASHTLFAKFLTGLTAPLFTKIKAKKMRGFAQLELHRFQQVLAKVNAAIA
ncbi:RecQ family ATP-dependent DNA helicase [Thalassotalea fusca]